MIRPVPYNVFHDALRWFCRSISGRQYGKLW